MAHYAMVIDTKSCCGCQTCAVACKTVNNLPKGVWYNRVITVGGEASECAGGSFPDCTMHFRPQSCQHCENPACVSVCPTGASYVADGGIVLDVAGAERAGMTVEDLVERFRAGTGRTLDNDRMLLSE